MQSHDHRNSRIVSALLAVTRLSIILVSILMVLVTLAQVIFRYVIAAPLPWSEELARYCFVWIVFLGGAVGLSRGIHLGVDLFVNMLPEPLRRGLDLLASAMIACFAIAVINASMPVLSMNMFQRSPALGLQMSYVYIAIPISMGLIALISAERIIFGLLGRDGRSG